MNNETRVCKTCKVEKPLNSVEFLEFKGKIPGVKYFLWACMPCHLKAKRDRRAQWTDAQHSRYREYMKAQYQSRRATYGSASLNAQNRDRYHNRTEQQKIRDRLVDTALRFAKRRLKLHGVDERVDPADLRNLYDSARGLCNYCGLPHGSLVHIDHIMPLSRGGTNTISNLAISCALCNILKGRRTIEEWLGGDWRERRSAMFCNVQPNNFSIEVPT